ncbi:MAG: hypothetical protein B6D61_04065 [Bacteroidetes bacterium 4484_249]|nr:MAG: hypothetical protein B6D61_04065 [Bacteroidetes bacterium 4484_249]
MKRLLFLLFIIAIFVSCSEKDNDVKLTPVNTLYYYINQNNDIETSMLIACSSEMVTNTEFEISVFFYPVEGASEYKYFESGTSNINPDDYIQYFVKNNWETLPVFNGYLRRFPHPGITDERWGIVTYKSEGKLHICDPIRTKQISSPTIYAPELINIDLSIPTEPVFSW